ncbi:MAG TPA: uridine kinase [Terriglobus sp.]
MKPVVLAVGGCSGSGKTTLARELAGQLDAVLFPLDYYYRDLAHLSRAERDHYNFDHPDSLEHDLIVRHVQQLRENQPIDRPNYDFSTHSRVKGVTDHVEPRAFVIVEGILALHYADLKPLYDLTVYVDAPHDVCLTRRIHRDMRERGRTEESVREQFETYAKPMADEYVVPCRECADITVTGTEALDWSIESVIVELRRRNLLPSA